MVVWDIRGNPLRQAKIATSWRAEPCWAYHVINVFDENGLITIDLNAYREPHIATGPHGFAYVESL